MDQTRFDALTRSLAAPLTRRRVLRALLVGGGGVLAVLGLAGPGRTRTAAQPGCRDAGSSCEGNSPCCAGLACLVTGPGNARRCARPQATNTPTPPGPAPTSAPS